MSFTKITEAFLAKIAGWEAIKSARALVASNKVLSSNWTPPLLKGVVSEGSTSYRAGLVIKDAVNVDNVCSCRASRASGMICAHSVAVGLHHLQREKTRHRVWPRRPRRARAHHKPGRIPRPHRACAGRGQGKRVKQLEISVILPPTRPHPSERGKVMVTFEGRWSRGRVPLSALPMNQSFSMSPEDTCLLDKAEELAGDETPGGLMLNLGELTQLLDALAGHPRVALGRNPPLVVGATVARAGGGDARNLR